MCPRSELCSISMIYTHARTHARAHRRVRGSHVNINSNTHARGNTKLCGCLILEAGEAKDNNGETKDNDDLTATSPQAGDETNDTAGAS